MNKPVVAILLILSGICTAISAFLLWNLTGALLTIAIECTLAALVLVGETKDNGTRP
jgi:hypothetical protein